MRTKRIPFSLSYYKEKREKVDLIVSTKCGLKVKILTIDFVLNYAGVNYPIVGRIEGFGRDSYWDEKGNYFNLDTALSESEANQYDLVFEIEEYVDTRLTALTITYNDKHYTFTHRTRRNQAYQGCDACNLIDYCKVDSRLSKICNACCDCGKHWFKEVRIED